ncbi:MAG TPA: hypothetical protein VGG42_18315 [Acidobacteriaceae bacterium]|jgi:hypothetical protein
MTMLVVVFVASFAIVAAAMMGVVWASSINAELKTRNDKHRRLAVDESYASWQRNREMIVY